ncbi:pirin family protein [Legionella jordanis]|uniref:Pirin-like protein n=1 Tax=Legionella jordanis TaxID=456 RepID=A0A0W0VCK2_9GAMM|nr:pirin family protein [Legionella jordanis]KTD17860.1 pirin-like protein [Legionella jordanis]RMX02441.1 pirin family protein [Legionella jordanis]RMX21716.1 pirin family protein [Legionella jordanis]VEH11203.1 pirin-like protein [Legionella jordanis]HAT8713829.1 quercetin 2,3-dioxygenase [Legionella jordanis]
MASIQVERLIRGTLIREGAGVKLQRYIGTTRSNEFDPILLLDFFDSQDPMDYAAGFPQHPHRGFETVTYVLKGQIEHQDNHGHHGIIGPGDVQWMTAGRGIIHSEMPKVQAEGLTGLQLWLNLPAASKLTAARYQEFSSKQLPVERQDSAVTIKVIAGKTSKGTASPIQGMATEPLFFDIHMKANASLEEHIPSTHRALLFVLSGEISLNKQSIPEGTLAALGVGRHLILHSHKDSHYLLIAAKQLKEPIAWLGPFVMNTQEEVLQALDDFKQNRF